MKNEETRWPNQFPQYVLMFTALALLGGYFAFAMWFRSHPMQRFYLTTYLKGSVYAGSTPAQTPVLLPDGRVRIMTVAPDAFHAFLVTNVYGTPRPMRAFRWPLGETGALLFVGLMIGSVMDRRRARGSRDGRLLRGPKVVSWRAFNRVVKGDGLRIPASRRGGAVRIALDKEAHHIQIAGATGSGKSTLVRSIVYQIEQRGEVAIIFDPDREYIKEFYREERGDWVLNPKDDRCPYWPIGMEAMDEAEATPIANGLFPEGPTVQKFFLNHTRAIFAYLLAVYRPTIQQLTHWMAQPSEIDKRVKGTEHQHTLTANAAPQRAGILGSLNEAGKPLRMMPGENEGRRVWTVREWAKDRRGWIFITSTPDTLDALRPLQSLWLDMLILKLQNGVENPKRVWMILDEVAALNQLPQLHSALTRQRKSDNPIVLGFQGMAQIQLNYGDKMAEVILSQAFTNIILRTREEQAARHLAGLIGKAEVERVREVRQRAILGGNRGSYSNERVLSAPVLESEIQGLDDLTGYLVQRNMVVPIRFSVRPKREIAEGLIERFIPMIQPVITPESEKEPEQAEPQGNGQRITRTAKKQWRGSGQAQTEFAMDGRDGAAGE